MRVSFGVKVNRNPNPTCLCDHSNVALRLAYLDGAHLLTCDMTLV